MERDRQPLKVSQYHAYDNRRLNIGELRDEKSLIIYKYLKT